MEFLAKKDSLDVHIPVKMAVGLCRIRIFSKFHVRSVPGTVRFRVYCAAESVNLRIRLVGSGNYESPSVGEPPLQESGLFQKFKNSHSDFDKTVIEF